MNLTDDVSAFGYLHKNLDEQRALAANNILSGRATPDEYHRLCGVIQGLDYAKELLKDLAKQLEEGNE